MKRREVYLDNNATTRVDPKVAEYMHKIFLDDYAVASSQFSHTPGIRAKDAVDKARDIIAREIHAKVDEIIFTSGATESNNLALKGLAFANMNSNRKKIIISKIEHFSVVDTVKKMERFGFKVEMVNIDNEGFIDRDHLKSLLDDQTLVVSVIHANHEVGTVQDIKTIAELVHKQGAYFHTNAAASFLQIPINVEQMGIDLMTITAHKIHGPKGVGALYVKKGIELDKINDGGYQEFNFRGGTENVPGIAGLGKAVEIFSNKDLVKVRELRNYLYEQIKANIKGILLNGASDFNKRIPNNLNVSFDFVEGESVVLHLDMRGIAVITGSACFSRSLHASHILLAMGFTHERAHGSIRFSLSKFLTKQDIDYTVKNVKEVVEKLRSISPLGSK